LPTFSLKISTHDFFRKPADRYTKDSNRLKVPTSKEVTDKTLTGDG